MNLDEIFDIIDKGLDSPSYPARRDAVEALGNISDVKVVPFLVRALKDEDTFIRRAAARALGNLGYEEAVEPLVNRLHDNSDFVREAVSEALVKLGEFSVTPLIGALGDTGEDVQEAAANALKELGEGEIAQLVTDTLKGAEDALQKLVALKDERAIAPTISALKDKERNVAAARALGKLGDERAVEPLIEKLGDGKPDLSQASNIDLQIAAAKSLGDLCDARAVEPLIGKLGDEDIHVREAVSEALIQLGEPAVEPLISKLGDKETLVREVAAGLLSKLGEEGIAQAVIDTLNGSQEALQNLIALPDKRALTPLISALDSNESSLQISSAWALGELGHIEAVEPLIEKLMAEDNSVQITVAWALGKLGDARAVEPLIGKLSETESSIRDAAFDALIQLGEPAVVRLIERLGDIKTPVNELAVKILDKLGEGELALAVTGSLKGSEEALQNLRALPNKRALTPLIAALEDNNQSVQVAAAGALGEFGDVEAVEPLIGKLQDGNQSVQEAAASALGKLGDERAVQPLIVELVAQETPVRESASEALVQLGEAAIIPLIGKLTAKRGVVLTAVVNTLEKLREGKLAHAVIGTLEGSEDALQNLIALQDERVLTPLINALTDEDNSVKIAAANALGELSAEEVVKPLIVALQNYDVPVQIASAKALGKLGDASAVEPLVEKLSAPDEEDGSIRETVSQVLVQFGESAVMPLIEQLGEHIQVRESAARVLGELGEWEVAQMVLGVLEGKRSSLRKLIELQDVRVITPLINALEDKQLPVQKAAMIALGEWGVLKAVAPLINMLKHKQKRGASKIALRNIYKKLKANTLLCSSCLTRTVRKKTRGAPYYACRVCGSAETLLEGILYVVAVVGKAEEEDLFLNDTVRGNWRKHEQIFDFDSVEIVDAADEQIERFLIQVGNDMDKLRRKKYKKMLCVVSNELMLADNTLRNLQNTFAKIDVETQEEESVR